MNQSSTEVQEIARKNESMIVRAIDLMGLVAIGEAVGKDQTTICKMRGDGRFKEFATMLAAMNLKVVSSDALCLSKKDFSALKTFADRGLHDLVSEFGE